MDPRYGAPHPYHGQYGPPYGGGPPPMGGIPPGGMPPPGPFPPPGPMPYGYGGPPPYGMPPGPPMGMPGFPPGMMPMPMGGPGMPPMMPMGGYMAFQQKILEDKPTTVYVGKIPGGLSDDWIKKLLDICGPIVAWRRMTDPKSSSLKNFGFCDYANADAALRAIRVLHDLRLGGIENLVVKVDEKTQKYLDEYKAIKRGLPPPSANEYRPEDGTEDEPVGPTEEQLEAARKIDEAESKEDEAVRSQIAEIAEQIYRIYSDESVDPDSLGDEALAREIRGFRTRKSREKEEALLLEKEKQKEAEMKRVRMEAARRREQEKFDREQKDFEREEYAWEKYERHRNEDFEIREQRERDRLRDRLEEIKLDAEDDSARRRKIRTRDSRRRRQRERDSDRHERELEESRVREEQRRLAEEERRREAEVRRKQEQEEERLRREEEERRAAERKASATPDGWVPPTSPDDYISSPSMDKSGPLKLNLAPAAAKIQRKPTAPTASLSGFSAENEDDQAAQRKKRPLVPLLADESQETSKKRKVDQDAQVLIDKIPSDKNELFGYKVDWALVESHHIVQSKMRPWVVKKIVEYLGEEETSLVDYICKKIQERERPQEILKQLQVVLDEEAEVFVVKLWRMLIFEMMRAAGN